MKATLKKIKKNIVMDNNGLTREIFDLEMRYVKITHLSCVLDHQVKMIR